MDDYACYSNVSTILPEASGKCTDTDGNLDCYTNIVNALVFHGGDTLVSVCTGGARFEAFILENAKFRSISHVVCIDVHTHTDDAEWIADVFQSSCGKNIKYCRGPNAYLEAFNHINDNRLQIALITALNSQKMRAFPRGMRGVDMAMFSAKADAAEFHDFFEITLRAHRQNPRISVVDNNVPNGTGGFLPTSIFRLHDYMHHMIDNTLQRLLDVFTSLHGYATQSELEEIVALARSISTLAWFVEGETR